MSTEDVIELGSSDDEKEPSPKKQKISNNAMVHIVTPCTKLPGITITPAGKVPPKVNKSNTDKGRGNNIINIGGKIHIGNKIKIGNIPTNILTSPKVNTKLNNKQFEIKKRQGLHCIPISGVHPKINPSFINKPNLSVQAKALSQGTKMLKNLPAGITIRRANNTLKRNPLNKMYCKKKIVKETSQMITPTVEIDDEEAPSSSMPQWYKRPEEDLKNEDQIIFDKKVESMEHRNNREPEDRNYVEIAIEDSPIKPDQSKNNTNACAITIEDSPVKVGLDKLETLNNSLKPQDKHSKKKLDYPHQDDCVNNELKEIEVDLIEHSAKKSSEECTTKGSKDNVIEDEGNLKKLSKSVQPIQDEDFHPIYQKFIETCFGIENSDDMKKIVEKKIKAYYKQCSKEYVLSEEFIDLVSGKIIAIEASPDKMYLYIKDVVDELNMQRKLAKANAAKKGESQTETTEYEIDPSEHDSKRQKQIRKLEKTLKKLHRAIQKLEEQEVDFDDEDDSVYLLTERYKERLVKVHAKFCQLTNCKMPSEPSFKLEVPPGRHPGPTKRLEKLINKRVPIGAPLPFPDFHDVLRCVRDANEEDKLCLSEMEMIEEARSLFVCCGKKLQRRRQENEWRIAASRLPINEDPAEKDDNLKKVLENNKQLAHKRESEVFNKYADRQIQLKLEAEEIGEKEAEESPIESEEEADQSNCLENKENRKDRLKRLLKEKLNLDAEKSSDKVCEVITEDNLDKEKNEKGEHSVTDGNNVSELQTISDDDKCNMETDVDELHLLQKLYSESEADSSESPISLSDSDDDRKRCTKDLPHGSNDLSIENSSYSESESNVDDVCPETRHVDNVKELQDSCDSKETNVSKDDDLNKREEKKGSNCYEINSLTIERDILKEIKSSSQDENIGTDLINNVGNTISVEVCNKQDKVISSCEIHISNPLSAVNNMPDEGIGEADEKILLESSDDDTDKKFKEPNSFDVEDDNISTSKISICSIESIEAFDKNVEAGSLGDTEKISFTNVDVNEASWKNPEQSTDKEQSIESEESLSKDDSVSLNVTDKEKSCSLNEVPNKYH